MVDALVYGIGCYSGISHSDIVTSYLYRFGAWLMHLFMVQVNVWYMLAQVIGTGCYRFFGSVCLVQVYWYMFTTIYLTMIV